MLGVDSNPIFQQLRKVELSHDDTELNIDYKWAVLFTRIPNLEYFSAHMLGGSPQSWGSAIPPEQPAQEPTSNLKTLLLSASMVSTDVIKLILSNCKALEIFEYMAGGASISYDAEYDPRGFIDSLSKYCSHSLERLVLEKEDCESVGFDIDQKEIFS